MLLRLSINFRNIGQQVQNFGLHNIFIYNWFERIRVPFLFRCFFFAKLSLFTLEFLSNSASYYDMNKILDKQNINDHFSIYNYFKSNLNYPIPEEFVNLGNENFEFLAMFHGDTYFFVYLKFVVLSLTDTTISIAAITSIISLQVLQ